MVFRSKRDAFKSNFCGQALENIMTVVTLVIDLYAISPVIEWQQIEAGKEPGNCAQLKLSG